MPIDKVTVIAVRFRFPIELPIKEGCANPVAELACYPPFFQEWDSVSSKFNPVGVEYLCLFYSPPVELLI